MHLKNDPKRRIIRLLRAHGITPTTQRVKIASALLERPQHVTADQVMLLANQEQKRVSKATIYNTLKLFAEKGLIKELNFDSSKAFYDSSTHTHHHFYNQETQELVDIPEEAIRVEITGPLPENTRIERVETLVYLEKKHD